MKNKTKNILTLLSGGLLLLAWLIYWRSPASPLLPMVLSVTSVLAGYPIFLKAVQASRWGVFSIELLVVIAVAGALIIGEYTESAVVAFLFLLGDYLERRTLRKTRASLRSLMDMAPLEAIVLKNGKREMIAADEVEIGDHVFVQPGGKIPVDGIVISGEASVSEAAITGESLPVLKKEGTRVFSGTIAEDGYLEVIAEKVGMDTAFSKIIELVEEAQESKAQSQKFMERFASYYTPAIVVLSVVVWMFMQDVHVALTFLVIACPGALVISVPVSIVAGIGNGAENGVLIKGGDKIENLAKVKAVVFDKTGTLTRGRPEVVDVKTFDISEEELLRLAASLEVVSEHHLGKTIVKRAAQSGISSLEEPTEVVILKGHGLTGKVSGRNIYIGNYSGAEKLNIPVGLQQKDYLDQRQKEGSTAVFVAIDGRVKGIISMADQVREEAAHAIRQLKQNGIEHTVMLTGDHDQVAQNIGERLGIDQVFSELLPADKKDKIYACMQKGNRLAMIGDGINDAPAIATADVGIAMGGTGTYVAMETADVVLMSDRLDKLPYAIRLARATVKNMKQNTYFSLTTVAFLLAGVLMGHIHLASGMLIHEISVLMVILNAMRLTGFPKARLSWNRSEDFVAMKKSPRFDELVHT